MFWLDKDNALSVIEHKEAEGTLSEKDSSLCKAWIRDGYLILPNHYDGTILDEA